MVAGHWAVAMGVAGTRTLRPVIEGGQVRLVLKPGCRFYAKAMWHPGPASGSREAHADSIRRWRRPRQTRVARKEPTAPQPNDISRKASSTNNGVFCSPSMNSAEI